MSVFAAAAAAAAETWLALPANAVASFALVVVAG